MSVGSFSERRKIDNWGSLRQNADGNSSGWSFKAANEEESCFRSLEWSRIIAEAIKEASSMALAAARQGRGFDSEAADCGSSCQQNSTTTNGILSVTFGANSDQFCGCP